VGAQRVSSRHLLDEVMKFDRLRERMPAALWQYAALGASAIVTSIAKISARKPDST
jgi:hypothetical protein